MSAPKSARNLCFTLNNWTEEELELLKKLPYSFIIIGREVGESGTPHLQGYVEFRSPMKFETLKKKLPRVHWEARRGSSKQASDYCAKDGDIIFQDGVLSQQGERTDLVALASEVRAGVSVSSILVDNPVAVHQYGRILDRIEDERLRTQFRSEMTEGVWFFGKTGVGKSERAFKDFDPSTCYVWEDDGRFQDNYRGQETVIIEEFRGGIPYATLLRLVDKRPFNINRRNRCPMPFVSKKVIITSSLPPEEIYHNLSAHDSLEQLYRRFKVFRVLSWTEEVEHSFRGSATEVPRGGNTNPPGLLKLNSIPGFENVRAV